jgi:hypothetical protein
VKENLGEEPMAFGRIICTAVVGAGLVCPPHASGAGPTADCSLRAAAQGACGERDLARLQDPATTTPAAPPPTKRRDSLENGAIIGGAIGLALGLVASGIADCPGDDPSGSCPGARVGGVVISTAFWAGVGIGLDALVTDRTHAVAPPPRPARVRTPALPPPSLRMTLRW